MTNRINTLTVVLSDPTRTDDVQPIIEAIGQLRGVASVLVGEVDNDFGARSQERRRLQVDVMKAFEVEPF